MCNLYFTNYICLFRKLLLLQLLDCSHIDPKIPVSLQQGLQNDQNQECSQKGKMMVFLFNCILDCSWKMVLFGSPEKAFLKWNWSIMNLFTGQLINDEANQNILFFFFWWARKALIQNILTGVISVKPVVIETLEWSEIKQKKTIKRNQK